MKKILYVTGGWGNGGIENLISLYVTNMQDSYHCDVFTFSKHDSVYTQIVKDHGGRILAPRHQISGNILTKNIRVLKAFVGIARHYDIVHYNTAFAMAYIHCLVLKLFHPNVKVVVHSHGDAVNPPFVTFKKFFHYAVRDLLFWVADFSLSCSTPSSRWLFPRHRLESDKFLLLKNATGLEKFAFNQQAREKYRRQLNVGNRKVVGTIGRIEYQKNPFYILKIIEGLRYSPADFVFLWIGTGRDAEEIKRIVGEEGLNDYVIFIDYTDKIVEYLSAMDVFVLPSRYEGLGIVLLEAQASGLFCLASDKITHEAKISDLIKFLPTSGGSINEWVVEIVKYTDINNRKYPALHIKESGYDLNDVMEKLKNVYRTLCKNSCRNP